MDLAHLHRPAPVDPPVVSSRNAFRSGVGVRKGPVKAPDLLCPARARDRLTR
jgi:hypothetical protein